MFATVAPLVRHRNRSHPVCRTRSHVCDRHQGLRRLADRNTAVRHKPFDSCADIFAEEADLEVENTSILIAVDHAVSLNERETLDGLRDVLASDVINTLMKHGAS